MPRKKATPENQAIDTHPAEKEHKELAALTAAYTDEERGKTAAIHRRLGRKQVINAYQEIGNALTLLDLQEIKKSKIYKGFQIQAGEKLVTVTTWAEYCQFVEGRSAEAVDLDLRNFNKLGSRVWEALTESGIGPSTMRALRQLPESDKEAIEQLPAVIEQEGNEAAADMVDALIERHRTAREKAEKERDEAKANHEAQGLIVKEEQDARLEAEQKARALKRLPPDEMEVHQRRELLTLAGDIHHQIQATLSTAIQEYKAHCEAGGLEWLAWSGSLVNLLDYLDDALLYARRVAGVERGTLSPGELLDWHAKNAGPEDGEKHA